MATEQLFCLSQRTSIQHLKVLTEAVPEPAAHEVLILIRNVALNFRDYAVAIGQYTFPVRYDVIPGSDMAGGVVASGSMVEGFPQGDKVITSFDFNTLYDAIKD
ncbi:hypothetical protein G7Z17_g10395 [Cylindrodendrum hubeiense]|uniref:Alcohol dehydrogenase-like N-terminal domain-containing protein n=1 Tax=Cylindrodendrum hubeiense TaxID=595255 RepID=A0A9P5L7A5_9HYPO|nr:hypothetical protein G7Z17_g10395 [Cylindrodendrum hubeiense]